jgi:hypothetical protein
MHWLYHCFIIYWLLHVSAVACHHQGLNTPPGKTRYPFYRRLDWPQGRSGQVQKISPPSGFDPRTVQPVASRYTDWATGTTFTGLTQCYFTLSWPSSIHLTSRIPLPIRSAPYIVGRDSSVGIETRYGLDGPGMEPRWGPRFSTPVQTGPESHPACYTIGPGFFPRVKRPGRGVDHPPTSSAEVKERVQLYIYSLSGPLLPVLG